MHDTRITFISFKTQFQTEHGISPAEVALNLVTAELSSYPSMNVRKICYGEMD